MKINKEFAPVTIKFETEEEVKTFRSLMQNYIYYEEQRGMGVFRRSDMSKFAVLAESLDRAFS